MKASPLLSWATIESSMETFRPASSGYTQAKRGFVTVFDGTVLFVKIGSDDETKKWIQKEIDVYQFLSAHNYLPIPKLLSINNTHDGLALEYLDTGDNWEWETTWTNERLQATIDAMDTLADIATDNLPESVIKIRMINKLGNPWQTLAKDLTTQGKLRLKLEESNKHALAIEICNDAFLKQNFTFDLPQDTLVHYDIRRDNCAWNANTKQVKIIDWNWLQLGNREIDMNALLVSVAASGFKLTPPFKGRLNKDALLWLAGAWFSASIEPITNNTSETSSLRSYQLESAITAYELAAHL